MKTLFQGAEAIIKVSKSGIIKDRIVKSYRLPALDTKLREVRTKKEARLLQKAREIGIPVPQVKEIRNTLLVLEEIKGKRLATCLDKQKDKSKIAREIGKLIGKLHDAHIIHGDLTTSNMILTRKGIYLVDFGLGFSSNRVEDKATDLHVFKEALEAKHYKYARTIWHSFLIGYKLSKNAAPMLRQLEKVELRGRYKAQY